MPGAQFVSNARRRVGIRKRCYVPTKDQSPAPNPPLLEQGKHGVVHIAGRSGLEISKPGFLEVMGSIGYVDDMAIWTTQLCCIERNMIGWGLEVGNSKR